MTIEHFAEMYAEEIEALGIDLSYGFTEAELDAMYDSCEAYRERQKLLKRITVLENKFTKMEKRLIKLEKENDGSGRKSNKSNRNVRVSEIDPR